MSRMHALVALTALAFLAGCRADESVAGYGASGKTWVLQEIDGTAFAARATLTFPEKGRIAGQAPCNRYFGEMTAPYPWFEASRLGSTKMACAQLAAETAFFNALSQMKLSEVSGPVLVLSNETGREMIFKAE